MIVREGSRDLIGSKGFELFRCILLGMNVPDLQVITTEAFRRYSRSGIDEGLTKELSKLLDSLGGKVAVRSSSVGEDLHGRSNAGVFRTFLNVETIDGLIKAVEGVWASADGQKMAVIIQKQLDPEIAGVLFTRDPLDGRKETIVEYVTGTCDSLVSGRSDPKRIIVKNDGTLPERENNDPDLSPLIKVSDFLESRYGYPLDIEWAYQENLFHILQVRPITKLPIPKRMNERTFSRVQAEQFYSGPVTPLFYSIFRMMYTQFYLSDTMKDLGIGIDVKEDFLIRHRNYLFVDTSIMEYALAGMPLREGLDQIWDTVPQDIAIELRKEKKRSPFPMAVKILLHIIGDRDLWINRLDRRFRNEVVPEILCRINDLEDPSKLTDEQLMDAYEQIMKIIKIHVNSSKWGIILYSIPLMGSVTHLLHKNDLKRYLPDIISGFGNNPTMDASEVIGDLASKARSNEFLFRIIKEKQKDYSTYRSKISKHPDGGKFIEYFENMLKIHGHRRISRDIYQPSWKDDPMIPFSIIRQVALSKNSSNENTKKTDVLRKREKAEQEVIRSLPIKDRILFRIISRYLVRYTEYREFQRFYLDLILAKMKDLFIEISERMVENGAIGSVEDIFFMDLQLVKSWLSGERDIGIKNEAIFNKVSFENEVGTPGKYLRDGTDFDTIDTEQKKTKDIPGKKIIGQPVSSGKHRGRILVVKDLDKNVSIDKGDILVTKYIDPGQTHIFLMAGALVLEVGGMLSHGAILAREFNIPTVAGVKDATEILRNEQSVVVNGSKGTVTILSSK